MGSNGQLRILVVEDNRLDLELVRMQLGKSGLNNTLVCVESRTDFVTQLENFSPDIILCDYSLPQFGAIEALRIVGEKSPDIPVIVVTGSLTDETAVDCLKQGAVDYVIKEKIVRLPSAIAKALELKRSKKEKTEAESRLKQHRKQLQVITNVLPALLSYISKDLNLEFCNQTYEEWFKCSQSDLVGRSVRDILGREVFENIQREMPALLLKKRISFECVLSTSGTSRFVNATLVPDVDDKDNALGTDPSEVKGFVCLITDISDRKSYENQLRSAKDEADAANQAKTQFLANMSHEMRTPLTAISGLSELLLLPDQNADERIVWIEKIGNNCEHLKNMIDEILDLSKVESGKLHVLRKPFLVDDSIAEVKSILYPLAKRKNLELRIELEGSIPATVFSDPVKLRHILLNIIGNAIKFSDSGAVTLRLRLEKEKLAFIVQDHGRGIPEAEIPHLFEPFMQVDNSMTRVFGGTGLGLAISRRFARALGGDVCLTESAVGRGSTFTITIDPGPVSDSKKIESFDTVFKSVPTPIPELQESVSLKNLKILLVEDAPENQFLVKRFLQMAGAEVDVASEGEEGVRMAMASEYDVILMDMQMPVLDGYHATSRLRLKGYKKPIIALTAHAFEGEKERCLNGGFDGFLSKPIKRMDLLNHIAKYGSRTDTINVSN